jgi:TRAP-type mannitol/chloroaromatic compound transport system permease small subunit
LGALLKFSSLVDMFNHNVGRLTRWLVLAAVLISAGNAISRKAFSISSNAYLEIQWYLFAGVFMLGAGYAFLRNVHVRIDFVSSKLSKRTNAIIDSIGIVVFVIPLCVILIYLSWPLFYMAYESGEVSQNAGGLIRWPVLLLIPVGFSILLLQSLSELIKRIAFLRGAIPEPISEEPGKSDQEQLAAELAAEAARHEAAREAARAAGLSKPKTPKAP